MIPEQLSGVLRQLNYVVLERKSADTFSILSEAPGWFLEMFPVFRRDGVPAPLAGTLPFLDNFLLDAEVFWGKSEEGVCESGTWIEKTETGKEIPLEAKAVRSGGKQILALHSPERDYAEKAQVLQSARNSVLEHEKLLSEIQKKEILLHCIVHDLSQPLSAMRGSFDCLAMEQEAARIAKYIELGKHASEQQESMIREILQAFSADLQASLEAEKAANGSPDLLETAQEAARTLAPAFEAKGVRLWFSKKLASNPTWRVQGEETRLCRVFSNLLENALRYTPPGSAVTIGMEEDGGYFKAYIDDEGPGLPEELRPAQIFALFGKGKDSAGKAGLGLYFCRITVERWGGSIGCCSLREIGSRFWFRLPRAITDQKSVAQGKARKLMDQGKQLKTDKAPALRILLADDQEDIRTLTRHQLERNGHEVVTVADGRAALEMAASQQFDVILLDEEMPLMSGPQVAHAIRESQKRRELRNVLIALTGNDTPEDRDRLISGGFDYVLGKPFRLESLDVLLREPGKLAALQTLPDKLGLKEVSSLEDLLQRVGGDEKLLRQMIRTFLRESPKRMESIQKSLERRDGEELSSQAHTLKGSVSIFGAGGAAQSTQSLQDLGRIPNFPEAQRVFASLQEEIAKLEGNLRGYAKQGLAGTSPTVERKSSEVKRPRPRGR